MEEEVKEATPFVTSAARPCRRTALRGRRASEVGSPRWRPDQNAWRSGVEARAEGAAARAGVIDRIMTHPT